MPDFVVAVVEFPERITFRLTASFYVGPSKQRGIEFHGDHGSLHLATWDVANSSLEVQDRGGRYEPVPLVRPPYEGVDWSRAIVDIAEAVEEGRQHRAHAAHAAHVVEVLCAIGESAASGCAVEVGSIFEPPAPLEWAL
jgi:predicted dehydrogenase